MAVMAAVMPDSHSGNKVTFFTIITRITSLRDKFGPPRDIIRYPVVDSSILLE